MAKQTELDVVLNARPYELNTGQLLLVPLLPPNTPKATLPAELWERVLAYAIHSPYSTETSKRRLTRAQWRAELSTVCRMFSEIVPPLLFAHPTVSSPHSLKALSDAIFAGDARWDSLRRILHSTPGRWVQSLDLSALDPDSQYLQVDVLLRNMLPLVPFVAEIRLNGSISLSRATLDVLRTGPHAARMRTLTGVRFAAPHLGPAVPHDADPATREMYEQVQDPILRLLRACTSLQELELVPPPPLPAGDDDDDDWPIPDNSKPELHDPLEFPHLHTLGISLAPSSPLVALLSRSLLPSLRILTMAAELAVESGLLNALGFTLRSLALIEKPDASPELATEHCPTNLLHTCPSLRHLILACSVPPLEPYAGRHPLTVLSIPRPMPEFLSALEHGLLPSLRVVQLRDTRWLRAGVASIARRTGVAGEMGRWCVRLGRLRIRVLDGAGREEEL